MSSHHRHQASLEEILDFNLLPSLYPDQRDNAVKRFYQIIDRFDVVGRGEVISDNITFNRPRLVRLTYEYALSDRSRDMLLAAFFQSLGLSLDEPSGADVDHFSDEERIRSGVFSFAEYLMDNFFLPLRAATNKTAQPTPTCHSAVLMVQGNNQEYTTTPTRLSALRGTILIRDHHRCIVSRDFDTKEAQERILKAARQQGATVRDDDQNVLSRPYSHLEAAHIIPHSLMRPQAGSDSRQAALAILNMFDFGIARLIEGVEIDRPFNALTLSLEYHRYFGDFQIFFTQLADQPHTYKIECFEDIAAVTPELPIIRTLFLSPNHNIDPPSSRLLAVHRAIAHILHLSGAGEYIEKLLRDMDEGVVRADGSTELDRFVRLRFGSLVPPVDSRVNVH